MRKQMKYIGWMIIVWLAVAMSSCIKEKVFSEENKANVTLRITDSRNTENATEAAGDNEGIKTLRVIVVNNEDNKVEINHSLNVNDVNEQIIIFNGITMGEKTFYVIANEASIGLKEDDYPKLHADMPEDFFDKTISDATQLYFPKLRRDIATYGLPITGQKQVTITKNATIDIPIMYAVAKISLRFINNTNTSIPIETLELDQFLPKETYLFKHDALYSTTGFQGYTFTRSGTGATIWPGSYETVEHNKDLLTFYVYETDADPGLYKMKMQTSASGINIDEFKQFLNEKQIKRNNWIQVKATIEPSSVNVNVSLTWEVTDWTPETIDVPAFN